MESNGSEQDGRRDAPRSGAPTPAPLLDKGGRNVPTMWRPTWNRTRWKIRRTVLDRLRYWQIQFYQCLWVTLTSAPRSDTARLRKHFQVLRKRIGRELGFPAMEYVCVDTREGHGVLHMIWAWKDPKPIHDPAKWGWLHGSFFVPFAWLQAAWKEIHGAFHVNVKRIGLADTDARRLSRYIVAQYCGGQDALVRLSQSKSDFSFSKARSSLLKAIRDLPERYDFLNVLISSVHREDFDRAANQFLRMHFRQAWDDLVRTRSCEAYGVQFVWADRTLVRV
jgi:hypothetical protein